MSIHLSIIKTYILPFTSSPPSTTVSVISRMSNISPTTVSSTFTHTPSSAGTMAVFLQQSLFTLFMTSILFRSLTGNHVVQALRESSWLPHVCLCSFLSRNQYTYISSRDYVEYCIEMMILPLNYKFDAEMPRNRQILYLACKSKSHSHESLIPRVKELECTVLLDIIVM